MNQKIVIAVILILVVLHYLGMLITNLKQRNTDKQPANISVTSNTAQTKPGNYQVLLIDCGSDPKATLATINLYRKDPLTELTLGIVIEDVNIYTAEDIASELNYIGARAEAHKC